jgi:hypothetical protein
MVDSAVQTDLDDPVTMVGATDQTCQPVTMVDSSTQPMKIMTSTSASETDPWDPSCYADPRFRFGNVPSLLVEGHTARNCEPSGPQPDIFKTTDSDSFYLDIYKYRLRNLFTSQWRPP